MSYQWQYHPKPTLFRAYDIRGIVSNELTADLVYTLGAVIGRQAQEAEVLSPMVVARDGRLHGEQLMTALIDGLRASGCSVIDLGCIPSPCLYFATHVLKTGNGIMLTGSHNPPDYNGLKVVLKGECCTAETIQGFKEACAIPLEHHGAIGTLSHQDIRPTYTQTILEQGLLQRPLRVVVDAGHGVAGPLAVELLEALGALVVPLNCTIDGTFPAHHPNPSDPKNLVSLQDTVLKHNADIGLAFDGDGDRLGVVDHSGHIIWPDRLLILLAKDLLSRHPGATVVFDVKCTRHVPLCVTAWGGKPIMSKTGHSFIKAVLKKEQALLGGEMSGHLFFNEQWVGTDDALLAAVRILLLMSREQMSLASLMLDVPEDISTPEMSIAVTEEEKFLLVEAMKALDYPGAERIIIDGLRLHYQEGWGLVRASNTTPTLVVRFEAKNQDGLKAIQDRFRHAFNTINPNLVLPF